MRLWSLHPRHLDAKGLVALWREALLAQAVLRGRTQGYRSHPQLRRFQSCRDPVASVSTYLWWVFEEACRRGYDFDSTRLARPKGRQHLSVTRGQLQYELRHLRRKLKTRDRQAFERLPDARMPAPHPMFRVIAGEIEPWEIR